MRVLVFGAGAIGSLLGYRLAHAGHDVTLVGRSGYVRAVQMHGLLLEEGAATNAARPKAVYPEAVERIVDLPVSRRAWDLILLTVKAYDTYEAAQVLAPYVSTGLPVLIVQNGVGGEELAQQVLEQAAIMSGVITLSVSVLTPGHISLETTRGGLSLAPTREGQSVDNWAKIFAEAGLRTATCRDYRAQKWSKLLLNMLANAIPAILDMTPHAVFADPPLFAVERSAFLEALAVMRALQLQPVNLPGYPVPILVWAMQTLPASLLRPLLRRLVASGRGEKKPSLQMDLASGRQRSEALYLNGAVVTHAERMGLDAPVNEVLLRTLMGIASGNVPRDEFRGHPQKLVARIQDARYKDTRCKIQDAGFQ